MEAGGLGRRDTHREREGRCAQVAFPSSPERWGECRQEEILPKRGKEPQRERARGAISRAHSGIRIDHTPTSQRGKPGHLVD